MADVPIISPAIDGYEDVAFLASSPSGDEIIWDGQSIVVEFRNTHSSAITITFSPAIDVVRVAGVGLVIVPDRVYTIQPGAEGAFLFEKNFSSAYVDGAMRLPVAYAGGSTNLKIRAIGLTADTGRGVISTSTIMRDSLIMRENLRMIDNG